MTPEEQRTIRIANAWEAYVSQQDQESRGGSMKDCFAAGFDAGVKSVLQRWAELRSDAP